MTVATLQASSLTNGIYNDPYISIGTDRSEYEQWKKLTGQVGLPGLGDLSDNTDYSDDFADAGFTTKSD